MLSSLQFVNFKMYNHRMYFYRYATNERARETITALVRISYGALWLQGASWKEPPLFGLTAHENLYYWISRAVDFPVFAPYTYLVSHVILPHFLFFAWIIFAIEILLGVAFVTGIGTRLATILALFMTINIALTVLATPNEWPWSYALMAMVALLLFVNPGNRFRPQFGRWFEND